MRGEGTVPGVSGDSEGRLQEPGTGLSPLSCHCGPRPQSEQSWEHAPVSSHQQAAAAVVLLGCCCPQHPVTQHQPWYPNSWWPQSERLACIWSMSRDSKLLRHLHQWRLCDDVFCITPSLYFFFSVLDAEFRANLVDEVTISCEKSIVNVIWGGRRWRNLNWLNGVNKTRSWEVRLSATVIAEKGSTNKRESFSSVEVSRVKEDTTTGC